MLRFCLLRLLSTLLLSAVLLLSMLGWCCCTWVLVLSVYLAIIQKELEEIELEQQLGYHTDAVQQNSRTRNMINPPRIQKDTIILVPYILFARCLSLQRTDCSLL